MKQIKRRLRALRLPGSLLALLLASSMLFNAFAVTVEQPSARGSGELPAEQTEDKSSDDEAEPKNNAGFSSQKEALESVGAEEGTRYKVTYGGLRQYRAGSRVRPEHHVLRRDL